MGPALGHKDYTATYITSKVQAYYDEVKCLVEMADILPHSDLPMQHLLMVWLVTGLTLCGLGMQQLLLLKVWTNIYGWLKSLKSFAVGFRKL